MAPGRLASLAQGAAAFFSTLLGALIASGCVSKQVRAPAILPAQGEATLADLIERVNAHASLQSLTASVDLQFETYEKQTQGEARRFRKADGRLLLSRPARIRLQVQLPLLKTSLAEMASDGERFQLLVNPAEYRAFIEGSAQKEYAEAARKLENDPELKKAGPLINVRPHHLTEAFLLEPIPDGALAFVLESREDEEDTRPRAKRGDRVLRSYYVLTVVEEGMVRVQYRFDRTVPELPLARKHSYGPGGRLVADITFAQYHGRIPAVLKIDRPKDAYSLSLSLRPDSIVVNRELAETAFTVTIPAEWEASIRRIHLDAERP